jgi:glycerol transport system ATP-binding protein
LDEPLANLDYKLREELREELPALFAQTGAILVYATTEPMEALLLGGRTTTLWEGRVTASGPAADTYRHPPNLPAARVFSDPPLNELPVEARGGQLHLPDGQVLPGLLGLPDGSWRLGFRAEHLQVGRPPPGFLGLQGRVNVTEIAGSESYVHVDAGVATWVALLRGVADLPPGEAVQVHVDPRCIMAFDPAGRHVTLAPTAPSRAVA